MNSSSFLPKRRKELEKAVNFKKQFEIFLKKVTGIGRLFESFKCLIQQNIRTQNEDLKIELKYGLSL